MSIESCLLLRSPCRRVLVIEGKMDDGGRKLSTGWDGKVDMGP